MTLKRVVAQLWLVAILVLVAPPLTAFSGLARLCADAVRSASAAHDVPSAVLLAITQTETGRGPQAEPWPWTVNLEGQGHYFPDRPSAVQFAQSAIAQGRTSFDVGCFQVNYRWHGQAFASVASMFDPAANADYAAGFLRRLYAETGDWRAAAGAYHSRTSHLAARYRAVFEPLYNAALASAPNNSSPRAPRTNAYPLLQGHGRAAGLGSLVPTRFDR